MQNFIIMLQAQLLSFFCELPGTAQEGLFKTGFATYHDDRLVVFASSLSGSETVLFKDTFFYQQSIKGTSMGNTLEMIWGLQDLDHKFNHQRKSY